MVVTMSHSPNFVFGIDFIEINIQMTSTHSQCKTLQIMILLLERLTYLCYGKVRHNCETPTGLWIMSSMSQVFLLIFPRGSFPLPALCWLEIPWRNWESQMVAGKHDGMWFNTDFQTCWSEKLNDLSRPQWHMSFGISVNTLWLLRMS